MIPRRRLLAPLAGLAVTALLPACGGPAAPAPVTPAADKPASAPATVAPAATPPTKPAAKPAPELEGLQWYNSPPLKLVDLRGRPVLLVFWSTI